MATTVSLLAELLDTVFQDNRDLLLELNVGNAIASRMREVPAISRLHISPDLHVDATDLPDDSTTHFGIVSIVFTIREYLAVFVGTTESDMRVGNAVSHFIHSHDTATSARLKEAFPDIFTIGTAAESADLDNLDDLGKVARIFIHVLRQATQGKSEKIGESVSILRQCPLVSSVPDDLASLEFAPDTTTDAAITMFSDTVEKLHISLETVRGILATYGSIPDEVGITSKLFGGALSRTTRFGCVPIDKLLRDGLRKDTSILIEGPAGAEKEILASQFITEGLASGGCVIIVNTLCSSDCIRGGLESSGLDMSAIESEGRLIFLDWNSRFTERVTSIDITGNTMKVSNDLTNLAVAIDMALKKADRHSQVRMVLEMASPTIITEGFDRVHEFLASVKARMKNHSCTGLVLLNPHMHTSEEDSMLEEIFDCTMLIERYEEHGRIHSGFRIMHLSGSAFNPSRLTMSMTQRGMEISGDDVPSAVLSFDHGGEKAIMGLLGIESLSADGLPMGKSFLVWIPSSLMPADYVKPVVMEAQKEGHAILLALTSLSTDNIGEWMSEKGLSRKGLIDRGLLQVVDWYGQKSAKVMGMETDEGIIRTSRDLTHLGVGIDLALRKISDQFSSLAVMEVHSQAIRMFDIHAVYAFAQSINAKLAERGFTSFMLMERNAHDPFINASMEELFDGVIDIRSTSGILELAILSIRGSHFQPEYRPLAKIRDRLTIDVSRRIPDAEIAESIASHGLSARLKELEKELGSTIEEKQALELRLAEFTRKEAEYEMRHSEMKASLKEIEAKLAERGAAPPGADSSHREEMARLLQTLDDMLEHLPPDIIDRFAKTDEYKLYDKIFKMYLEEGK